MNEDDNKQMRAVVNSVFEQSVAGCEAKIIREGMLL
ncbi:hypothetical protein X474_09710 [Dethiosulfatarculus sandiegensis]|uniref:Uncharacterized protein n=1 Tax=Dethiosulfatarculus sandiegensis TaxID=1429043 RepID=A0A0D2JFC2_9BACT|nr:hypothetical protein X474_09710 [Dethiosulfatarculus sandiegensis]